MSEGTVAAASEATTRARRGSENNHTVEAPAQQKPTRNKEKTARLSQRKRSVKRVSRIERDRAKKKKGEKKKAMECKS